MKKLHFFTCAFALLLLAVFASCSNDTNTITKKPPSIESLAPLAAEFGDTVVVTGSLFNRNPQSNRIIISPDRFSDPAARRVIVPLSGSGTELRGIVPDGSFAGSVRVEDVDPLGGVFAFGLKPPTSASNTLPFSARLRPGDVGKAFFSGTDYGFSITAGASSEDYLVMLFSDAVAPNNLWTYLYNITAQSMTVLAAGTPSQSPGSGRDVKAASLGAEQSNGFGAREREFERRRNEEIGALLKRAGEGRGGVAPEGRAFHSTISGRTAPQTVSFRVLVDPTQSILDPGNFATVTADLKFSGDHTLLYVDTETPALCLSDVEAANLGQIFDASLYGTDRNYFGNESDINDDGKVAILLSPRVNEMTPAGSAESQGFIAGYFLPNDLLPGLLDSRLTNGMEIFYAMIPDPTGQFGNVFPKDRTLPIIEGVLAHEFLHMILFNYRILIYGRGYLADYMEDIWLNEGLAHIAEDLNGYESSNIARANLYLADPGGVTLIYGGDELDERGASFLFLRYLGDRFGTGTFKELVQSKRIGVANVEGSIGAIFKEVFADWMAACYLSGRGITSDTRFNYSSLDLPGDFRRIFTITGVISGMQMNGFVKSMAPEYLFFTIPAGETVDFTVGSEASGRLNAVVIRTR